MICEICNFPYWISQCHPLNSGRAEGLKKSQSKSAPAQSHDRTGPSGTKASNAGTSGPPIRQFFPLGPDFSLHDRPQPQPVRAVQASEPHGQRYTSEEIEVLRWALENSWITIPEQSKVGLNYSSCMTNHKAQHSSTGENVTVTLRWHWTQTKFAFWKFKLDTFLFFQFCFVFSKGRSVSFPK